MRPACVQNLFEVTGRREGRPDMLILQPKRLVKLVVELFELSILRVSLYGSDNGANDGWEGLGGEKVKYELVRLQILKVNRIRTEDKRSKNSEAN